MCNAIVSWEPSFLRTILILSPFADMICQEPLFTHSWMSARAIKLFVVLPREKRILRDTTKNTFYSFTRQIRKLAPADFPFFSFMFQPETTKLKCLSLSVIFEVATTRAQYFYLHEHRICLLFRSKAQEDIRTKNTYVCEKALLTVLLKIKFYLISN